MSNYDWTEFDEEMGLNEQSGGRGFRSYAPEPIVGEGGSGERSQFTKGLLSSIDSTQAMGGGFVAMLGDAFGADSVKRWGLDTYNENMAEAEENAGFARLSDVGSAEDFGDWLAFTAGQVIPTAVTSIAGGGFGAVAGRKLVEKGLEKYVKEEVEKGVALEVAQKAATKKLMMAKSAGALVGENLTNIPLNQGSVMGELQDVEGEGSKWQTAFTHGAAMGVLDSIVPLRFLRKMGVSEELMDVAKDGIVKSMSKQMALEGITEASQELIEEHAKKWIDDNRTLFSSEQQRQYFDAFGAGSVGGAMFGAIEGVSNRGERVKKAREDAANKGGDALDQAVAGSEEVVNTADPLTDSVLEGFDPNSDEAVSAALQRKRRLDAITAQLNPVAERDELTPDQAGFLRGQRQGAVQGELDAQGKPLDNTPFNMREEDILSGTEAREQRQAKVRDEFAPIGNKGLLSGSGLSREERQKQVQQNIDQGGTGAVTESQIPTLTEQQKQLPPPQDKLEGTVTPQGNLNNGMDEQALFPITPRMDSDPDEIREVVSNSVDKVRGGEAIIDKYKDDYDRLQTKQKRQERLPQGLTDERFLREGKRSYQDVLPVMVKELVKGGGIAYVRNEHGVITGRTSSSNPQWGQDLLAATGASTDDVKRAVDKALKGEALGSRQARIISMLMDEIDAGHNSDENLAYTRELREQKREQRKQRQLLERLTAAQQDSPSWDAAQDAPNFDYDMDEIDQSEFDADLELSHSEQLAVEAIQTARHAGVPKEALDELEMQADSAEALASSIYALIRSGKYDDRREQGNQYEESNLSETSEATASGSGATTSATSGGQAQAQNVQGERVEEQNQGTGTGLLTSYTEQELAEREAQIAEAKRKKKQDEAKAKIDEQTNSFSLIGSNRPADANPNQLDLTDPPTAETKPDTKPDEDKPTGKTIGEREVTRIKRAMKRAKEGTPERASLEKELRKARQQVFDADRDIEVSDADYMKWRKGDKDKSSESKPQPYQQDQLYAQGTVLLTTSGASTTPFPKVDTSTRIKTANTLSRVDQWLAENALAEAERVGDNFNARQFREMVGRKTLTPADKDSAESYLFDEDFKDIKKPNGSILKPLAPNKSQESDNKADVDPPLEGEALMQASKTRLRFVMSTTDYDVSTLSVQLGGGYVPRKVYALPEMKALAQQWGAQSTGNVASTLKGLGKDGGGAHGGFVFESQQKFDEFREAHGSTEARITPQFEGIDLAPIAFDGWREDAWKAVALYAQLAHHNIIFHDKIPTRDLAHMAWTSKEASVLEKILPKIDEALADDYNAKTPINYLPPMSEWTDAQIAGTEKIEPVEQESVQEVEPEVEGALSDDDFDAEMDAEMAALDEQELSDIPSDDEVAAMMADWDALLEEAKAEEQAEETPTAAKPEKPQKPEKPSVSKNTVFTEDAAEKARALLKAKLGQMNSGLDPELVQAGITLAGYHIEKGARTFAAYSKAMVNDLGDMVKPYLKSWYMAAKYDPRTQEFEGLSGAAEVEAANIDDVLDSLSLEEEVVNDTPDTNNENEIVGDNYDESDDAGTDSTSTDEQSEVSGNEQDNAGTGNSGTRKNGGSRSGSSGGSRGGRNSSTKRSGASDTETSSLNLDDVEGVANGTPKERVEANLSAIRLAKQLVREKRKATLQEKETLARYVGWGGLREVFDSRTTRKYAQDANNELKSLVTETEYNNIRASITTAFYTSKDVVKGMWAGVEAFGLNDSKMRIVEPSVGSGNFIGWQPADMRENSDWFASEIDTITGTISSLIYDDATIQVKGFQDAGFKENVFSLAIGNPPFGANPIYDDKHKDISGLSLHNYMVAKSAKLLHDNGLMMMVITKNFLDTKNQNHAQLSKTMEFVGAVRLPNTAFKSNAGTEVTTDIVVFRKLKKGEQSKNLVWTNNSGEANGVKMNQYFIDNPDMVLGRAAMDGTMYGERTGGELTVHPTDEHSDLQAAIAKAMKKMADGVDLTLTAEEQDSLSGEVLLSESDLPVGGMMLNDKGKILLREEDSGSGANVVEVTSKTAWSDNARLLDGLTSQNDFVIEKTYKEKLLNTRGKLKANNKAFKAVEDYVQGRKSKAAMQLEVRKFLDSATSRLGDAKYRKLKSILNMRNTALSLIRAEKQDLKEMNALRKKLNQQYDAFVLEHSTKTKTASIDDNLGLLRGDLGIESGLDSFNKASGKISKHAIFDGRVIESYKKPSSAKTVDDAVSFSMQENGKIDLSYVAKIMGISRSEAKEKLTTGDSPYLFLNPETGDYDFVDDYLSGNVKAKYKLAQEQGLDANIKHLERVLPADIPVDKVKASIRAPWVDAEVFKDFLEALGGKAIKVSINRKLGKIMAEGNSIGALTEIGAQFKNDHKSVIELFNAAANGKSLVIYEGPSSDRRKDEEGTKQVNLLINNLASAFETFVQNNEATQITVAQNFNDRVNTQAERKYNGRLYFKPVGQNPVIEMRKTQLDGAARMVMSKSVLLDHTVGAGKTFTAISGVMQRRRLGLSKKPLITVPNHIIGSFAADFYELYAGANILVASEKQMSAKNRKQFFARAATGDYDAIIMGHSHLKALPNSYESFERVINAKIAEYREALEEARNQAKESGSRGSSVSQIEQAITRLNDKLKDKKKSLESAGDDIGFEFEDVGFDYLVVDEAHEFKNLTYSTSSDQVVGMNSPAGSDRALDLLVKLRDIQSLENGGVTYMTGTPISNSLVEVYTMMYYLQYDQLKEMDIAQFDAFAGSFLSTDTALEYTPTGTIKERRVLKGIHNVKALSALYRQVGDVITREDMVNIYAEDVQQQNKKTGESKSTRFPIPNIKGGERQLDMAEATESQKRYNDYLIARMEGIQAITGREERREYSKIDNPLWVLSDAKKASLDSRLVDPTLPRDPTGKVARAAKNVKRIYDQYDSVKGTQLIFSDMGTPAKTAEKNARADLVALAKGVMPSREATAYVRSRLELYDTDAYSMTFRDIAEKVNRVLESEGLTGDKAEKVQDMMRELESTVLTADTGFSVYDDLKAMMMESGIPENEIAFIHDYKTVDAKQELFDLVNNGEIRVLLGSSQKMGAGTNAQKRLVALHHMDAPWRPSDMEQREGRIIRQGNMLYAADPDGFEVEIVAYATQGSSDPVMWQILERKAKAIEQFRSGGLDEFVDDSASDADSYANFKASSTGNPIYKLKLQSDLDKANKMTTYLAKASSQRGAESTLETYPDKIARYEAVIPLVDNFAAADFDLGEYADIMQEQQQSFELAMDEFREASDRWSGLEPDQKKKEKKPERPKTPSLLTIDHPYADMVKERIINPATAAVKDGENWSGSVDIGNGYGVSVSFDRLSMAADKDDSPSYRATVTLTGNNGKHDLHHSDVSPISTVTGSMRLLNLLDLSTAKTRLSTAKAQAESNVRTMRDSLKNAEILMEGDISSEKAAAQDAVKLNNWLSVEERLTDIQEQIRRGETPNKYIDSDTKRNVSRTQFNMENLKPVTVSHEGDTFKTLGVEFDSIGGAALPAIKQSTGEYVHLYTYSTDVDIEAGNAKIEKVDSLPEGAPSPNKQLLETLGADVSRLSDSVRFSKGRINSQRGATPKSDGAISAAQADKVIRRVTGKWGGANSVITLVDTFEQLPQKIKDIAANQGTDEVYAVFDNDVDTIYLVRDMHKTERLLEESILHEALGHYGVRKLFGQKFKSKLGEIFMAIGGRKGVIKFGEQYGFTEKVINDYIEGFALEGHDVENIDLMLMDELLAHMAQKSRPSVKRKIKELIGLLRAWLNKHGFIKLSKMGETDLFAVLSGARKALKNDTTPPSGGGGSDVRFSRDRENSRIGMNHKEAAKRVPAIQAAAKRFEKGEITKAEFNRIQDANKPAAARDELPKIASVADMRKALASNKVPKIGATSALKDGERVGVRLDIPAYTNHGVWIPTVHKGSATVGYVPIAGVRNPVLKEEGYGKAALKVAMGEAKSPFAQIKGEWNKEPIQSLYARAQKAMQSKDWVQVGFDPERRSYYYNADTMEQVVSGDELIQVGPTVLVKNPKYQKNPNSVMFSRERVLEDQELMEKMGLSAPEAKTLMQKIYDIIREIVDNLFNPEWSVYQRGYEGFFDGMVGLKRAEDRAGVTDMAKSGYVGARLATGVADVMSGILKYGAPKWKDGIIQYKEGTQGLMEIFAELGPDLNDWLAWMGSKRAQELMEQGRENNLTEENIQTGLDKAKGKEAAFKQAHEAYKAINQAMLDLSEEAGLIDAASRAEWESEYYIPFYRQADVDGGSLLGPRTKRGLSHQSAGVRQLIGGTLPTNDLLSNILTNWIKLTDSAMKNSALLKAVDNLKDTDDLQNETMRYTQAAIPKSDLNKRIKADREFRRQVAEVLGFERDTAEEQIIDEVAKLDSQSYEMMWAITAPTDPDVIRVSRNGKNEYYRVHEPSLLRAFTSMDSQSSNSTMMRGARYFKRLLTTGVTASPDFIVRNFIRDAVHAWAINPDQFKFGVDSWEGMKHAWKEDEDYRTLMFAGASFQGGYVHGTDPNASADIVRRALEAKGLKGKTLDDYENSQLNTKEKMKGALSNGWQTYRGWGDKVENANRLGTFKKALAAGKPLAQAVYESKDLMDYSLRGNFAALTFFTDFVPFLNARLQGLNKLGRASRDDWRAVAAAGAKIAMWSVALAFLNDDEERYEQLPDWDKDANWHIFMGDHHFRIPKPFEIGIIFGTMPERMAHVALGNQPSSKLTWSLAHNIMHTLNVNPIPQAVMPVAEVIANKSFFFGTPIEGMSDEGKLKSARFNSRTSSTAVALRDTAAWLGLSPKELEHLWKGYTGTLGIYALGGADLAVDWATGKPVKPDWTIDELPVFKALYRGTKNAKTTQYATDLYERTKEVDEIYRTIRAYQKDGDYARASELRTESGGKLKYRGALGRARQQLGQLNKEIDRITKSTRYSASMKRSQIERLRKKKNELSKRISKLTEEAF
jgi:N12 class adenine-specific DNA methylase